MAIGAVTRGTTGVNRLRRIDRWIAAQPQLRQAPRPLVVDLGYGASGTTALELYRRLSPAHPGLRLIGIEIAPERVEIARRQLAALRSSGQLQDAAISFERGGFEVPLPGGERAAVIRALNVLRQYQESEVVPQWRRMLERLSPGGLLVEGTSSELGRVASWVGLGPGGPDTFTVSLRLQGLETPAVAAERLPKVLIHRNIPGEPVHAFLTELERQWHHHAALGAFGPVQRWTAAVRGMRQAGWPVLAGPRRWRLGEVTVPFTSVQPTDWRW